MEKTQAKKPRRRARKVLGKKASAAKPERSKDGRGRRGMARLLTPAESIGVNGMTQMDPVPTCAAAREMAEHILSAAIGDESRVILSKLLARYILARGNDRLLDAAPEMYAVILDAFNPSRRDSWEAKARAVLAKATAPSQEAPNHQRPLA